MPDLIVIVPSRGRPQNIVRLLKACAETCTADTLLRVVVDADDPMFAEYASIPDSPFWMLTVQSKHKGHGPVLNAAAVVAAEHAPCVGKLDDDHVPRTEGWDRAMLDALDKPGVAYGNDLHQGERLPTTPFITSDIIKCLGFYCPPGLTHLYVDDFWLSLGKATILHYLPDVIIEHMHVNAGKAENDEGYVRANSSEMWDHDAAAWGSYLLDTWPADKAKLQAAGLAA